jgi:hypothetical protein
MKRTTLAATCVALLGLMLLAGCGASTKLVNVWTDPAFQTNSLKKLMVLGVAQNASVRHVFEDEFVKALKAEGVDALPSYAAINAATIDSLVLVEALQRTGCDGIFITRLVDHKTVETYYPPTTSVVAGPSPYYYGGWYGYYNTGYSYVTSPGYTVQNEVVNLETNLYRLTDARMVWSALSESWIEQTTSRGSEIQPFVTQLVYGLTNSKIVAKTKK